MGESAIIGNGNVYSEYVSTATIQPGIGAFQGSAQDTLSSESRQLA